MWSGEDWCETVIKGQDGSVVMSMLKKIEGINKIERVSSEKVLKRFKENRFSLLSKGIKVKG